MSMTELDWWKSSYSAEAANCVCVALAPDGTVRLRDSKVPAVVVSASPRALRVFVDAVGGGALRSRNG
jgi:hypothetical protein